MNLPTTNMGLIELSASLAAMSGLPLNPGSRACVDHDPLDQCPLCKQFHPARSPGVSADSREADRLARDCKSRLAPGPNSNADYLGGASDQCITEYR